MGAKWVSLAFGAGLAMAAAQANAATYAYQSFAPPPGVPAGDFIYTAALNDHGQALVVAGNPNVSYNFTDVNDRYDVATHTYTPLPPAPGATPHSTTASGINDAGQIVGTYHAPGLEWAAYLNTGGVFTPIGVAGHPDNEAFGISNNGKYISGMTGDFTTIDSGYILHNGVYSTVTPVTGPSYVSAVFSVNNSGNAVGEYGLAAGNQFTNSFFYSGGVYTPISLAGWTYTGAVGINDAGVIAGDVSNDFGFTTGSGFVEKGGVVTLINFPGATSTYVQNINDRGQLIGEYQTAAGDTVLFIATPVPEPATWAMMILGLLATGALARSARPRPVLPARG